MASLSINACGHRFAGANWLFRNVSFEAQPGSVTALVGPSGSGKSTLLAICGGLTQPAEGAVRWNGSERVPDSAWIFQESSGVARRSAVDHVALPLLARGYSRRQAELHARELLDKVDLAARAHAQYRHLSGGEGQRVALARALATGRQLMLADEPTAQLDRQTARLVCDLLRNVVQSGPAVIVATHDPAVAEMADRIVHLVTPEEQA